MMAGTATPKENPMNHITSVVPMPANENGRGNLAGHKATCSCGWVATTTMGFHAASLDASDHVAWAAHQKWVAKANRENREFRAAMNRVGR